LAISYGLADLGFERLLFVCASFAVFAAEALHSAGGIHQFLLAGKERMAIRADFYVNIAFVGGSGAECVSACAMDAHFLVCGMDRCLH